MIQLNIKQQLRFFFFFTCIILFINNILYVKLTSHLLLLAFMAIGGCLIGTYVGTKILQKISMKIVRRFAYIIMLIAGIFNLIKGIF